MKRSGRLAVPVFAAVAGFGLACAASGMSLKAPTPITPAGSTQAGPLTLVALGDSYSSGNGTPKALRWRCHRSPQAWPELVPGDAESLAAGKTVIDPAVILLACSGAASMGPFAKDLPAQVRALKAGRPAPGLVTVTIGGNDGLAHGDGFFNVLLDCYLERLSGCDKAIFREARWIRGREPALLDGDYRAIRRADHGAAILAVGYPRVFATSRGCTVLGRVFTPAELAAIDRLIDRLNSAIAQAASTVRRAQYVNISDVLAKHELCSANGSWVFTPSLRKALEIYSWFHPTLQGQMAIANAVAEFIVTRL